MSQQPTPKAKASKTLKYISHLSRLTMGLIFVVSGFVKAIDPWGTMIKVDEYLMIYGWERLIPHSLVFSIWLCGAELMMGLMLTFKVRIRFVSIFALLSMTIFTVVTFLSATVLPVEDCGCFGEALKLTPWQTFFKNLTLWPMAFIVFWRYRPDKIFLFKRIELMLAATFFSCSMGLATYCYRHLPLIDYLPYRIGVNLPEAIAEAKRGAGATDNSQVTLVYRNKKSGKLHNFSMDDKEWHNSEKWEWVETQVLDDEPEVKALIGEFSLRDSDGVECTEEVLAIKGNLHILFVASFRQMGKECSDNFTRFIDKAKANGDSVIAVTPGFINRRKNPLDVESYNIDPTTMKTALRANYGVISLRDGVIVDKRNCRDM